MMRAAYVILIGALVFIGLGVSIKLIVFGSTPVFNQTENSRENTVINLGQPTGGAFTLTSHTGEFSLQDLASEQLAIIYFGYTWCPDVCPTAMHTLAASLEELPKNLTKKLQPIFISVDPKRDTPERLAAYVDFFEADFLGLTGSEAYLQELTRNYGAFYRYVTTDSAMGYTVDHSSNFYVVNASGTILRQLSSGLSPTEIAAHLQQLLTNP